MNRHILLPLLMMGYLGHLMGDKHSFGHGEYVHRTTMPRPSIDKHGQAFTDIMKAIDADIIGVFTPNTGTTKEVVRESPLMPHPFMCYEHADSIDITYVSKSMMRKVKSISDEHKKRYADQCSIPMYPFDKRKGEFMNVEELQPNGDVSVFAHIRRIVYRCKEDHALIGAKGFTDPLKRLIGGPWNNAELHNFMVKIVFAPDMCDDEMFEYIVKMVETEDNTRLARRR